MDPAGGGVTGWLTGTLASAIGAPLARQMMANVRYKEVLIIMDWKIAALRGGINTALCVMAGLATVGTALAQTGTAGDTQVTAAQTLPEETEAPRALVLDASAIIDAMTTLGYHPAASGLAARASLGLTVDGQAFGWTGFSANVTMAGYLGPGISEDLGDVQGLSNVAAPRMVRPINAWAQWSGAHLGIKAGIIDTNADFDEQNVGALFLNGSHGMGADLSSAGLNGSGPSPFSALGAIAYAYDDAIGIKLRVGMFAGRSGDPDRPGTWLWSAGGTSGHMVLAEADWQKPGWRVAIGGWRHTARLEAANGEGTADGATGAFVLAEATLLGAVPGTEPNDGQIFHLDGWLRFGHGFTASATVRDYVGGGLVARGLWRGWSEDALGLAVAHARLPLTTGTPKTSETVIEANWEHHVNGNIVVQPYAAWILGLHSTPDNSHALVTGLRLIMVR